MLYVGWMDGWDGYRSSERTSEANNVGQRPLLLGNFFVSSILTPLSLMAADISLSYI